MSITIQTIVQALLRCTLISALTMLLFGCRRAEPAQPSPIPESAATQPHEQTIRFGTAQDLTIELPSGWEAVVIEQTEIERRLTDDGHNGFQCRGPGVSGRDR